MVRYMTCIFLVAITLLVSICSTVRDYRHLDNTSDEPVCPTPIMLHTQEAAGPWHRNCRRIYTARHCAVRVVFYPSLNHYRVTCGVRN